MGRLRKYTDDNDKLHAKNREQSKNWYYRIGKERAKLRHMIKYYNIDESELEALETLDEKLEYCKLCIIQKKYGIKVADIDDNTTVNTEVLKSHDIVEDECDEEEIKQEINSDISDKQDILGENRIIEEENVRIRRRNPSAPRWNFKEQSQPRYTGGSIFY